MEALDHLTVTIVAEDSVGYETPYLGQHGISFYVEARHGTVQRNILVDVAQHPEPLLFNMEQLQIDPESIDTVVLTHCHYDHTQGLAHVLSAIGKTDLPVVAHPDLFRLNFITNPYLRHVGVPTADNKSHIEEAGGQLFLSRSPLELMPGLTTSGEVDRTTDYEGVEMALKTIRDEEIEVDHVMDEISLFAMTHKSGLVVITGCSHAGIVNISMGAKKYADESKVGAVIGGFHLVDASPERIKMTASALDSEGVDRVMAGHCTGFPAQAELYSVFGERFHPLRTGDVFEL